MITEDEITEQTAVVERAEKKLDEAEAHHDRAGDEMSVAELRVARVEAHGARDKLRHLRARYASEQASAVARDAAERGFPEKARKALAGRLAAGRDEAVRAVTALEQAAAEALRAVAAYSELVQESAAELRGRGLDASDGQELGGTAAGTVHVGGDTWRPADPGSLLAAVLSGAVAEHAPHHPLAAQRWRRMGGLVAQAGQDELLHPAGRAGAGAR